MKRREYLKVLGGVVGSVGLAATVARPTDDYRLLTVPEGEQRRLAVGDGETLENLVIDITNANADAQIVANGSDWAIRNVSFVGSTDLGAQTDGFANLITARGDGVIEHCYLGDGVSDDGIWRGAIGIGTEHSGHVDIRDCQMSGWTDNAVYAATMAEDAFDEAGHGTLTVDGCYLRDNNVAHLRLASDGTAVRNTVIENTSRVPSIYDGVVSSRGIYTGYGDPEQVITVENCDVNVTPDNTNGIAHALVSGTHPEWGPCSTLDVTDSTIIGEIIGHVETFNSETFPEGRPPKRS